MGHIRQGVTLANYSVYIRYIFVKHMNCLAQSEATTLHNESQNQLTEHFLFIICSDGNEYHISE